MNILNIFPDVNKDAIENIFITTQQNLDELSKEISSLNNSQEFTVFI